MINKGKAERRQADVRGVPAAGAPARLFPRVRRLRLPRLLGGVRGAARGDGRVRRHRKARPGGRQGNGQLGCHLAAEVEVPPHATCEYTTVPRFCFRYFLRFQMPTFEGNSRGRLGAFQAVHLATARLENITGLARRRE